MQRSAAAGVMIAMAASGLPTAEAHCSRGGQTPAVLTAAGAELPADGGILVGYQLATGNVDDHALDPRWTFAHAGKPIATHADRLAPGVVVYRADQPLAAGTALTLDDRQGHAQLAARAGGTAGPALPAPHATAAEVHQQAQFRSTSARLIVDVDDVPDAAFGVIVYDAHRTAISFRVVPHVRAGATQLTAYQSASRCAFPPDGERPPAAETITLAWVDRFGRVSPPSKPIAVAVDAAP